MAWLKQKGSLIFLHLFAGSTLVYVTTQGSSDWFDPNTFDPILESGKWAIRFLLLSLTISPLNTYFGWRRAITLRKPFGLWAFGYASLHVWFQYLDNQLTWLKFPIQPFTIPFITLGLLGLLILTALAVTSNRPAMKLLGKNWKRLHKTVYLAGPAVIYHGILALSSSKRMMRDPQAEQELNIYLAALAILMAVRIPLIRRLIMQLQSLPIIRRTDIPQVSPHTLPHPSPGVSPLHLPIIAEQKPYPHQNGSSDDASSLEDAKDRQTSDDRIRA